MTSDGTLYEWDIFKGMENDGKWVCSAQKVVPNNRPILGFSAGEGYVLILGDIVRQIETKERIPHTLSCI